MIHLHSFIYLTAPRQSSRPPITLRRLAFLHRARKRRESKRAEFEHVAFVQEGSVGGRGSDGGAIFVVGFPFGDVGEERPDLRAGYVEGDAFVGDEVVGCAGEN